MAKSNAAGERNRLAGRMRGTISIIYHHTEDMQKQPDTANKKKILEWLRNATKCLRYANNFLAMHNEELLSQAPVNVAARNRKLKKQAELEAAYQAEWEKYKATNERHKAEIPLFLRKDTSAGDKKLEGD